MQGFSVGDGFKFGCGFFLAAFIAWLVTAIIGAILMAIFGTALGALFERMGTDLVGQLSQLLPIL
jgi:integral membrane sensor domain MASE1